MAASIERGRERAAVAGGWGVGIAGAAEQRRHTAQYAADDAAHDAPGAVKHRLHRLAGSAYDAAHGSHRPEGVGRRGRDHRRLGMNDDLTTLAIMVVIAVPIVLVRVVLLR